VKNHNFQMMKFKIGKLRVGMGSIVWGWRESILQKPQWGWSSSLCCKWADCCSVAVLSWKPSQLVWGNCLIFFLKEEKLQPKQGQSHIFFLHFSKEEKCLWAQISWDCQQRLRTTHCKVALKSLGPNELGVNASLSPHPFILSQKLFFFFSPVLGF
jgi:hypothetical protein